MISHKGKEVSKVLFIEQLEDGCYHVIVDYSIDGFGFRYEWTFREIASNANPDKNGLRIMLTIK